MYLYIVHVISTHPSWVVLPVAYHLPATVLGRKRYRSAAGVTATPNHKIANYTYNLSGIISHRLLSTTTCLSLHASEYAWLITCKNQPWHLTFTLSPILDIASIDILLWHVRMTSTRKVSTIQCGNMYVASDCTHTCWQITLWAM